ncbi:SusC/RagA family TonB-linked outer membrane protein [Sphingobacterium lactis]|uniref:SusC/RagA family TonB-linked outer membrane protein n=1 Tax=Sphingobacterium lactis TaxID=797291 RepID=UPI003F80E32A
MMRTLGFFLLLFQISIAAEGQGVISLRKQQIKVSTLVQEIKKQSGFRILYSSQVLSGDEKLAVDFENSSLETVIASLAKQLNVGFEIKDQTVLLTPIAKSNKTATNATSERQQSRISGQVKDEKGNPLRGATVVLVDKNQTVSTGEDGSFSFDNASIGSKIRVQYIGYQTQTVTVNSLSEKIEVQLNANPNVIEDVVVTALGIKRAERSLSYNVQQVGGDELTKVADANLINALNGKVAGVNINSSSAGVGAASKVVLRGAKSISKDNNVLYVIDGIPMYNRKSTEGKEFASTGTSEGIADVNPEDIESMSVLTGAAAAALYGSEAANGAIVITTKKGTVGKTTLSVSQNTQFHNAFVLPEFQNRYGTGSGLASNVNDKSWGQKLNDATFMGYDPAKDYLHTGSTLTEGVTFSTGTEKNQTYASAAAVNSKGIIPNSSYDRYNFTFRNSSKFLDDKLSFDAGLNYIIQNDQNMTNQGVYSNPLTTAYLFPRGDDWDAIRMFERYDVQRKINTQYWPQGLNEVVGQNPYWINYRNMRNTVKNRYMINASLNYKLNDWLSFTSRGRLDNIHGRFTEKLYASTNTTITDGSANGFFGNEEIQNKRIYGDVVANFNKTFDQFSIQANLGAILQQDKSYSFPIRGPILENGIPNIFNITQIDDRKKSPLIDRTQETQSMFVNMELGYKNTYFLTATGRNDWASQLAGPRSVQSSFFYPSIGASIMLSEALELPEAISYLKLRSSYASVGTPFPEFLANPTYTWDVATQQYTDRTHYPISDLKPERTNSFEVGLAAKFLNGFNLDVSLYHAMTLNQTFDPKISVSSGYSTLYVQTGRVLNKGIELALGYDHTWENSLRWASNFTFSANKNRIEELVRDFTHPETGAIINKNRLDVGGLSQARFILKEGGTLGDLYSLSDIRRDDRGLIYVDEKGQISENNNVGDILIGSVLPKANMAWRNSLDYKGFNFDFMFAARLGGVVYSATQAFLDYYGVSENSALARDQGGVLINGTDYINAESYYNVVGNKSGIPQYYAYSASNVRLQEVSLGYTFPKSLLKEKGQLSVSLIGRNLLMLYKKAPFDPESTASTGNYYQGIDYFMVPNTRNLGFNVRLKF